MNDLDKTLEPLSETLGIENVEAEQYGYVYNIELTANHHGDKVDGYTGFSVTFEFDEDGSFIGMGIWE